MRLLLLLLCAASAFAIENKKTFTASASQTNRRFTYFVTFHEDETCDFARPYIDGAAASQWQTNVVNRWDATAKCPSGSVHRAFVTFYHSVTNTTTYVHDFRYSATPCHLGSQATCDAAAETQSSMLAFNGGTWDATIAATPWNNTGASTVTRSARTMMAAGAWSYRIKGPLLTQVMVEDRSTALSYDFGFRAKRLARQKNTFYSTDTSINSTGTHWASIPRPFKIVTDGEHGAAIEVISICHADGSTGVLTVGTTNGSTAACANVAGRGQDGTSAVTHYGTDGGLARNLRAFLRLKESMWITSSVGNTFTVNDASSISSAKYLFIGGEVVRVCNKSSNTLTVGVGSWPCSADSGGREIWGSSGVFNRGSGTPVVDVTSSSTDFWVDSDISEYKSVHPLMVLSFYTGWAGVGIEYHLVNAWTTRLQDQNLNLTFSTSAGSVGSHTGVRLYGSSKYKWPYGADVGRFTGQTAERKVWDGTAPSAGVYDFNLAYLRYAGDIPYDPSIQTDQATVDYILTNGDIGSGGKYPAWDSSDKCKEDTSTTDSGYGRSSMGPIWRIWGDTGGRGDIGINALWFMLPLYMMGRNDLTGANRWMEVLLGQADCSGRLPITYWEGNSGAGLYCYASDWPWKKCTGANTSVSAFGRPFSIDAHPGSTYFSDQNNSVNDFIWYSGDTSWARIELGDVASHFPETGWIPYALFGDWYLQQNAQDHGAWGAWGSNSYPDWNASETNLYYENLRRMGSTGWPGCLNGCRSFSWTWRILTNARMASWDGTPEFQYFDGLLKNITAMVMGKHNLQEGSLYEPCADGTTRSSSRWCAGRRNQGANIDLGPTGTLGLYGAYITADLYPATYVDETLNFAPRSGWMDNYFVVSLGDSWNKGLRYIDPIRKFFGRSMVNRYVNPAVNPMSTGEYREPGNPCVPVGTPQVGGCGSQANGFWTRGDETKPIHYRTWASWFNGFTSTAKTRLVPTNDNDMMSGHFMISLGALSFYSDIIDNVTDPAVPLTGHRALEWAQYGPRYNQIYGPTGPMWLFSPSSAHEISDIRVIPSTTSARVIFTAPNGGACSYLVSSTPITSTLVSGYTAIPAGNVERAVDLSGLVAATPHYLRIACNSNRAAGTATFTTLP